jgi:integrase
MPIYKQPNSNNWLIEFKVDGKRYRRSSETNIKRKAIRLEEKWRQEIHEGKHQIGKIKMLTIEDAADRYFKAVIQPKNSREKSKKAERYCLNVIVRYFSPKTRIDAIQSADIANWRDQMLSSGATPATANRYLASLRAVLNRAYSEWGALKMLPQFHLLPLQNHRCRFLNQEEEKLILDASKPHLRDLIIILVDTGARLSEALDLKWDNVDLDGPNKESLTLVKTKNGLPRRIPLTTRATKFLLELRRNREDLNKPVFLYHAPGTPEPVPFKNPHGAWKTALRESGVDTNLRIHDLRHTFASRLVSKGVPIFDVSKLLGHKSITMTMRYAHLAPVAFESAIEKLEDGERPKDLETPGKIIDFNKEKRSKKA